MITSVVLVALTIIIQVWLLSKVKQFVSAKAVHDIRIAYDKFELAMYGEENCTLTVNKKHRGIPGHFPPLAEAQKRLNSMTDSDQDDICRIPLSQPHFFGLILLIWTMTILFELRKAFSLQLTIMMLPHVPTMAKALGADDDDSDDLGSVIRGMTFFHKFALGVLTFLPRVGIAGYLLWVGCRWLLATNNFGDLILNAVALEFILLIKEGLYNALMPYRNQFDLSNTKIHPYPKELSSAWWNFVNTVALLFIAVFWVFMYMYHWQQVLPNYNWDVHLVCEEYIKVRYAV